MGEGAVSLIDCLGYKGIWQKADPDTILNQLKTIQQKSNLSLDAGIFQLQQQLGYRIRVSFLSDTVAIGFDVPKANALPDRDKGKLLHMAAQLAQKIAGEFLRMTLPLAMRGCVVYGRFEMNDNFLIGPAVDEAAEWHEKADGAFIWIPPTYASLIEAMRHAAVQPNMKFIDTSQAIIAVARSYFPQDQAQRVRERLNAKNEEQRHKIHTAFLELIRSPANNWNLFSYALPLKGGERLDCLVVDPVDPSWGRPEARRQYELAMRSDATDVIKKRENTLKFFDHAQKDREDAAPIVQEHVNHLNQLLYG